MGIIVPTLLTLILFFCITTTSNSGIVDKVCNKNVTKLTGYQFCKDTVGNSTNEEDVADHVFRIANQSAGSVEGVIRSQIIKTTRHQVKKAILQGCLTFYKGAVGALGEVLDDINTDTYCRLKRLSGEAQRNVIACKKGCNVTNPPLLKRENDRLFMFTEICKSISNLFKKCE